ncbi:MAG: gamma carbonic anhydrase family protein [Candidatus Helarchaeota archaeon]
MILEFSGHKPKIHETAWIAPTAIIIGNVVIGERTGVWFNVVIRADNGKIEIGKECIIEDNCVLHSNKGILIGNNVIINHNCIIHGAKIQKNVLLGSNVCIYDNVEIGEGAMVENNSILLSNQKIPSRVFIKGDPYKKHNPKIKIIRKIKEDTHKRNIIFSKNYVNLAMKYKSELIELPLPEGRGFVIH